MYSRIIKRVDGGGKKIEGRTTQESSINSTVQCAFSPAATRNGIAQETKHSQKEEQEEETKKDRHEGNVARPRS
jgi:hypothetical protein